MTNIEILISIYQKQQLINNKISLVSTNKALN
jgi:hypothetical protein